MADHLRGDDPAGAAAFWDRNLGWGVEYARLVFDGAAHRAGGPGRVSPWQVAAVLHPGVLRDALTIRLDRRMCRDCQ